MPKDERTPFETCMDAVGRAFNRFEKCGPLPGDWEFILEEVMDMLRDRIVGVDDDDDDE